MSLIVVATACSSDPSDADHGDGGSGGDVTLDTLPADQRAAFETWKAQPIKDCLWTQAFPGLAKDAQGNDGAPSAQPHVDVTALYVNTQGSPLIQLAQGEIVLLGSPVDDSGTATNGLDASYSSDGQTTRSVSVHAVRDAGECVVTLANQEVFRTRMAASIEIVAFASAATLDHPGTDLTAPVIDPTQAVGAVDAAPLLAHALQSLAPVDAAPAVLGARFGADAATSHQVFTLGAAQRPVTARPQLAGTPEVAPDAVMYGPSASIAPLAGATSVDVDLLFAPPTEGVSADHAGKLFVVRAAIAVGAHGSLAHATSITVQPAIDHADAAAIGCFASRLQLAGALLSTTAPRLPGFDAVFASCSGLAVDGHAALVGDAASQQRIARATFTGPVSSTTEYLGWDTVFLEVVDRLITAGTALATLDPDHTSAALDAALTRATTWLAAMPSGAPAALRASVVPTALRWTLDGVTSSGELDGLIPAAFTNAAASYPASVGHMIDDATAGADRLFAARCGANLVGDHAARVAATIAHAASVPAAQRFTDHLRDQLLQVCPDDVTLAQLDASIDPAGAFATADRARGASASFDSSVGILVDRGLRESWTTQTYAALGDLLALAVVRTPTCAAYTTYSDQLVLCVDGAFARFSAAPGKLLDPALVTRQAAFAHDVLPDRRDWLPDAAFATTRGAIDTTFFDRGLWTGCSDQGFAASEATLLQTLDQLHVAAVADRRALQSSIVTQVVATSCP